MLIKLSVALVGAFTVAAQAHYGHRHVGHEKRHKPLTVHGNYTSSVSTTIVPPASTPISESSILSSVGNSPETTSSASLETFPTFAPTSGSSSAIYAGTGSSAVPTVPLTTGPSSTNDNSPVPTGGNHTLVYTLGTGSSKTVITTTIFETSTQTNVHTVSATSGSDAGPSGGLSDNEPTTTITSTSTSTQYKTIVRATSSVGNSPVGASGSGKCPAPVTVTVTGSPMTVTVTAGSGSGESPETAQALISSSTPNPVSSTTKKTKTKCPTASTGFITKPYPTFTSKPSASITFPQTTGTAAVGYM
ncbi:MAG: hypothetical protein Q9182_007024 [Xanthomendoza sp. 2 TL-2023]